MQGDIGLWDHKITQLKSILHFIALYKLYIIYLQVTIV